MQVAQRLYENGHITYMRTDSITLSQTAINAARAQARELYGAEYVPDTPRVYTSKVKNAQEAHEAIRPAGDRFRTPPRAAQAGLSGDELRLYELIWKRTVASQMKDATGESVSVRVGRAAAARRRGGGAPSSPPPARSSPSTGSSRRTSRAPTTRTPSGTTGSAGCRRWPRATRCGAAARPGRARHPPAGPLHRGDPGQGAGGPGDRAAVHLRLDHRHDPRPRVRVQEGHRAGALLPGLRRRQPAGAALRPAGRLRLHRPDGGRARRDRPRRGGARARGCSASTSARTGTRRTTRRASRNWSATWATSTPGT